MIRSPLLVSLLLAAAAASATAQTVPTGFVVDTLVSTGLATPNDCCFLPDGRCLVANSAGGVTLYAAGTAMSIGTVPAVESGGERGLLSIAADPGFAGNGHVYVYYSSTADAFMHLDRFTCTGDLANPASANLQLQAATRHVILGALPDNAGNHNGGSVRFGPDGRLYLSVGDDASACSAQSLTSQVGCLLRLDPSVLPAGGNLVLPSFSSLDPGDNPQSAQTDFRQLVLAHGLRNPFRMEIDPLTGNLYIGDVGAGSMEEYSEYVYAAGALPLVNFGWPWREGNQAGSSCGGSQPAGLVEPIASVSHGAGWASVMGGARYRNRGGQYDFGSGYEGDSFFLDYFAGELRRLTQSGGVWAPAAAVPGQPSATNWGAGFNNVTSLRLGPDGGLWFTQHQGGGALKRVRLLGPVNSVATVSGGGQRGPAGEPFPQPLVVQVRDPQGNPLPGGTVNFAVTGGGALSTTNPVLADAQGFASTTATSTAVGGAVTVTATTPGGISQATFGLFGRRIAVTPAAQLLVVSVTNQTSAVPPQVPYIVMLSFPGSPTLPTIVGNLCIDPGYALAVVIEDGTGAFGFVSFSGTGGIGAPSLTKVYTLPPGLFAGQLMRFQALGFDAQTGWFRTNCESRLF
jgi:glucose/arabinose dehydrogenase